MYYVSQQLHEESALASLRSFIWSVIKQPWHDDKTKVRPSTSLPHTRQAEYIPGRMLMSEELNQV